MWHEFVGLRINPNAGKYMKFSLTFFALFLALKGVALAKVVMIDDRVFLRHDGRQIPVFLVNDLIDRGKIKKVNLFGEGRLQANT